MYPNINSALIVDDDEDVCYLLKKALSVYQLNIATAHTLEKARHCLTNVRPSLVLLDNNLPDGSGIELIDQIKASNKETHIIMITADAHAGIRETALKEGADRFITKPFDLKQIVQEVKSLLYPSHD